MNNLPLSIPVSKTINHKEKRPHTFGLCLLINVRTAGKVNFFLKTMPIILRII